MAALGVPGTRSLNELLGLLVLRSSFSIVIRDRSGGIGISFSMAYF